MDTGGGSGPICGHYAGLIVVIFLLPYNNLPETSNLTNNLDAAGSDACLNLFPQRKKVYFSCVCSEITYDPVWRKALQNSIRQDDQVY